MTHARGFCHLHDSDAAREFRQWTASSFAAVVLLMLSLQVRGLQAQSNVSPRDLERREFFEAKIRPLLVRHCYECHSGASNEVKGGLRLDWREAVLAGGDSGPALVPGNPDDSLLLNAVKHEGLEMPPGRKLADTEVQVLKDWIFNGAFDPRDQPPATQDVAHETFEALYQDRRKWWSLQPLSDHQPPQLAGVDAQSPIDAFVSARLHQQDLKLAPAASRETLARRAAFALTGLPPNESQVSEFLADTDPHAWARFVDGLLASPHFGERWARHWMDVVRYTDTYGYEWDMPAKGAWRFRDYLIRAFNDDIPFDQLVREQIAGDLLKAPRVNTALGINESRIGPMFFQMGEKRHGDSAEFNGIHQEMLDNKIDAFGKAFLATTVSCARCHDHKLDAISQRDYYALGGMFMNARWMTNTVSLPEYQQDLRVEMRQVKNSLRDALSEMWLQDVQLLNAKSLAALTQNEAATERPLEDVLHPWTKIQSAVVASQSVAEQWTQLRQTYEAETVRRVANNASHFDVVADFRDGVPSGWSIDGVGLESVTPRGDFIVALSGEKAIDGILFGGLCTNTLSPRMNGAVRTPFTKMLGDGHLSFEVAGGDFAARRTVVDNAFLTERQQYLADPFPKWQRVDSLSSMPDRNVYLEFATKTSNPNFPPRVGLGGACSEEQAADPRSWFQISRVIRHQSPAAPQDELSRMQPLFADEAPASIEEVAGRYREVMTQAIKAWRENQTTDDHVRWLQWMLTSGVLKNQFTEQTHAAIFNLVTQYRTLETRLQEPATVNGLVDTDPPMDYRLNVRGDYDQLGDAVPHGSARFLMDVCGEEEQLRDREELAGFVTSPQNPLTSRVYVNRVWHWLFGAGLVTTTDDFGHAGEKPSHPDLLDYLARRFMNEGWSTKKLIRLMLLSRTWQQSQDTTARAIELDPSNRLLHHFPVQRLDAESLRDAMLAVSGRLDDTMHGPTANPWRLNEDPQKRLFSGPIDGLGRRSIYTKITIMEPPRFLATFNQPAPKIPTGRRDISTTPAQSLTLLNDPFVAEQAKYWATQLVADADLSAEARLEQMFLKAYGRRATETEITRWMEAVSGFAADQEIPAADVMKSTSVWQTIAHAVFNTKEFLYVR